MRRLNIILGNATINTGNKGCSALCITTMYLIDEILCEHNIKYNLYLCDSGYPPHRSQEYKILDKCLKFKTCGYPFDFQWKDNLKSLLKGCLIKNQQIFKRSDFIFDIGQGDSFADIYGPKRFEQIDRIHKVARLLSKPYCLLPQTIGPFKDPILKNRANKSMQNSSLVMTRDRQSLEYVRQNVPQQKQVDEYIDVAFFMPYKKKSFDKNYIHVGLNISALLWNGGYTQNNQFELNVNYQELITQIIDFFLSQDKVKLHLIPHVVSSEREMIENDYAVSFKLCEKYNNPNLILSEFFLGPIEAKNYISGMDFFMGARMHSTIAAFSTEVPVIPMAYSRKFNGLFNDTLNYPHVADMRTETDSTILQLIQQAYANRNQLKEDIAYQQKNVMQIKRKKICDAISKFLNL